MNPGRLSAARLAVVLSHPVQYYAPWFQQLARVPQLHLRVFYLWDFGVTARHDRDFGQDVRWDIDLLEGYEHEFIPNQSRQPGTKQFSGLDNPTLVPRLLEWAPDAILLFGYKYLSHVRLLRAARRHGWPLLFRGDSHLLAQPSPSLLKQLVLRQVFRRFAACTYVGAANRDYLRAFGVPPDRLFFAPHAVDGTRFVPRAANQAAARTQREQLGIEPTARVFLFSGKFEPKKRPDLLVRAFQQARPPHAHLILAGSGAMRSALEAQAAGDERIHFLPFANQQAMPTRYLVGDVLVLPSSGPYETWGLAVNEAMHAGRPALVSDVVGCQRDLVEPDKTGWVFPADSTDALAQRLQHIASLPSADFERVAQAAPQRVSRYSYAQTTEGLLQALRSVIPPQA